MPEDRIQVRTGDVAIVLRSYVNGNVVSHTIVMKREELERMELQQIQRAIGNRTIDYFNRVKNELSKVAITK